MPSPNRRTAERKAKEVLARYRPHGVSLPVDVRDLASRADVKIIDYPLDPNHSGVLVRKNGQAVIVVNENHHPRRQRFSIAHELGHLFLHEGAEIFHRHEFHRPNDSHEVQANYFAAEILMPAEAVRDEASKVKVDMLTDRSVLLLARRFDVSVAAMTARLERLGLVRPESHW